MHSFSDHLEVSRPHVHHLPVVLIRSRWHHWTRRGLVALSTAHRRLHPTTPGFDPEILPSEFLEHSGTFWNNFCPPRIFFNWFVILQFSSGDRAPPSLQEPTGLNQGN